MLASSFANLKTFARNALFLEGPLRQVAAMASDQLVALRGTYRAAERRASIADQLVHEDSAVAALVLYREAFALFARAVVISRDAAFDASPIAQGSPLTVLTELARQGRIPSIPAFVSEADAILSTPGQTGFDTWDTEPLLAKRAKVEKAVRFLRGLLEPRSVEELKDSRLLRVSTAGVVILAAIALFGWRISRPTNIALHKPVTASGRFAGSVAPPDNSGLVNGRIEPNYGVHTALGGGWVMIDLLQPYKISQIKVFNRGDAAFDDGIPFTLEFSQDGNQFVVKTQRPEPFTASDPWIYEAGGASARYLRIRSNAYVALTEVEVYGRR